jgi:tetratricopeptide (TPR) repeat protein
MSDIPSFPYALLWQERQVRSVANLTRADAVDLLATAARVPLKVETEPVPLADANRALGDLRAGRVRGAAVLLVAALAACGPAPRVVARPVERAGADASAERALAERLWGERLDESQLRAALAAWKRAIARDDADVASYAMAARASFFLADGFLALDGRREEMVATFEDGAALAERGLRALSPEFERRRRAGGGVDVAAVGLGREAVPLLYYWGHNVIRWADAEGRMAAMRVYQQVFHVMEQVRGLDPGFDHGGADRFFGAARAESPAIAGGSLEQSRAHFERALELAPDWLENHRQRGVHYARRAGDAALYAACRRRVLEAPPDGIPEQEIARRKMRLQPETL